MKTRMRGARREGEEKSAGERGAGDPAPPPQPATREEKEEEEPAGGGGGSGSGGKPCEEEEDDGAPCPDPCDPGAPGEDDDCGALDCDELVCLAVRVQDRPKRKYYKISKIFLIGIAAKFRSIMLSWRYERGRFGRRIERFLASLAAAPA